MQIVTKVIHGDAGEELREIDSDSIDLIITSPPYALLDALFVYRDGQIERYKD